MKSMVIPFNFVNGKVSETENNSLIAKQRIIDALTTDKYERVNRPEYGTAIRSLLFEPLDPLVFSDYRMDAIRDVNDYVSNAKIMDIQVRNGNPVNYNGSEEANLVVRIVYKTSDGGTATFVANFNSKTFLTEESTI